nr:unnamed protein product [Digitaria exilis]
MAKKVESMGFLPFAAVVTIATLLMLPSSIGGAAPAAAAATGAEGSINCTRSCGNISIHYPFGIEPGCYHGPGFNLTCRNDAASHGRRRLPKLFLGDGTVQVLDISVEDSTVRINSTGVEFQYNGSDRSINQTWGLGIPDSGPYFLSESKNMLEAIGCNVQVSILGGVNNSLISSCSAICPPVNNEGWRVSNGTCTGIGCCQASIVLGYPLYNIQMNWLGPPYIPLSAYIVDKGFDYTMDMLGQDHPQALPATLDWLINNSICTANKAAPECRSAHSYCQDSSSQLHGGYICQCNDGYQGNPYVHGGCQDIDECKFPDLYVCYGICKNKPGNFSCECGKGYTGNASVPNGCRALPFVFLDIDECEHQESYSCYGSCQNLKGSFNCQCPNGTYGTPFINGGCIAIRKSFTGEGGEVKFGEVRVGEDGFVGSRAVAMPGVRVDDGGCLGALGLAMKGEIVRNRM